MSPGDIWQFLWLPLGGDASGIEWVEGGDAVQHPTVHRTAPYNLTRSVTVQRQSSPGVGQAAHPWGISPAALRVTELLLGLSMDRVLST